MPAGTSPAWRICACHDTFGDAENGPNRGMARPTPPAPEPVGYHRVKKRGFLPDTAKGRFCPDLCAWATSEGGGGAGLPCCRPGRCSAGSPGAGPWRARKMGRLLLAFPSVIAGRRRPVPPVRVRALMSRCCSTCPRVPEFPPIPDSPDGCTAGSANPVKIMPARLLPTATRKMMLELQR